MFLSNSPGLQILEVDVMAERVRLINPDCKVETVLRTQELKGHATFGHFGDQEN